MSNTPISPEVGARRRGKPRPPAAPRMRMFVARRDWQTCGLSVLRILCAYYAHLPRSGCPARAADAAKKELGFIGGNLRGMTSLPGYVLSVVVHVHFEPGIATQLTNDGRHQ